MKKKVWRWIFTLIPLAIGTAGFLIAGEKVWNAAFYTVTMYVLNYGEAPANWLVEAARWTAPVVTAGWFVFFLTSVWEWGKCRYKYLRYDDSVAVYGPEDEQEKLLRGLGKKGVCGSDRLVPAHRYIFLNDESESLAFCEKHKEELKGRTLCIRSSMLPSQTPVDANIRLYSPEEIAARRFWKTHCIFESAKEHGYPLDIAVIGFGRLGEELLYWGLQENVFSANQEIRYHVYGDCGDFLAVHEQIREIRDPVIHHTDPWRSSAADLRQASMVIVLEQEDQLRLLRDLNALLQGIQVFVFSAQGGLESFEQKAFGFTFFNWKEEASVIGNILEDDTYSQAKDLNRRYASIQRGCKDEDLDREKLWQELPAFSRMSNVSAADYHEIRKVMAKALGIDMERLSKENMEFLAELEHERWCRFHYLNNWKYGVPENGTSKDPEKRIHQYLVPYQELDDPVKELDRSNIDVLRRLDRDSRQAGEQTRR